MASTSLPTNMEPPWSLSALCLVVRPTVAPPCLNKDNLLLLRSSFLFLPWVWTIPYNFSILSWKIPWTEEPSGLYSTGWQRSGQYWIQVGWISPKRKKKIRYSKICLWGVCVRVCVCVLIFFNIRRGFLITLKSHFSLTVLKSLIYCQFCLEA